MTAESDLIAQGLLKAIKGENDGYNFYKMAANSTQDTKGRQVFETLAEEERRHMAFLKHQHRSLIETGKIDPDETLGPKRSFEGLHPIFSEELQARVKDAHFEMTALSIGIKLELSAIEFYKSEAQAHDDKAVRKFYTELAEWETGHYETLLRQHEALKEEYWAAGGFSPF